MNSLARNTVKVGLVSAAGILLAGSAAYAAPQNRSSFGNAGIANGDQIQAIVQVPVDVCGNAISLVGDSSAWCQGGSTATISDDGRPAPRTAPCAHLGGKATAHHAVQRPGHNHKTEGLPLLGDGLTGRTGELRTLLGHETAPPMDALIGQTPTAYQHAGSVGGASVDHC